MSTSHPVLPNESKFKTVFRVVSGNFLEMYDFMVYGYYASAIAKTYFPSGNEFASLMLALSVFGAGFLMRPVGAIVLGAYIDHHGRRKGLILTLTLMAIGTACVALVPGYATIGLLAPIIVLGGRLLQGFSAGVELGGVSVYLSEIATQGNKGFYCSWQSGSQQVAVVFAALIGVIMNRWLPADQMSAWGWRVPFLIGCLIVPFLFIIRRSLQETDEFLARKHRPAMREIAKSIGAELGHRHRRHGHGDHDDRVVLHDHRLYADVRQGSAEDVGDRHARRDGVRRFVEPLVAAGDGRAVRPHRPPARIARFSRF